VEKKENKKMNILDEKDHKGQFFLIAAVVIIVVVVSIVTITNYTQKRDVVKLYDLGQELGIESQNVLDYGTYSELNESEMKILMENFITNYVGYMQDKKNIYFIFGNSKKINVIGYQEIVNESVCVKVTTSSCAPYLKIGETQEFLVGTGITKVAITIGGIEYDFKLKRGENFYFVIWQSVGGEKHVITN
jgi:hypothetical protein